MNTLPERSPRTHFHRNSWVLRLSVALLVALSGVTASMGETTAPAESSTSASVEPTTVAPRLIDLATAPLYARGIRAKPTLSLALSVEFPTVGAQYINPDYSAADAYIGYFNPDLCYHYDINDNQFNPSGNATAHTCSGTAFSGNFMNWATSSAIDILRFGLTGGDRVVDTATSTVLQRAVIPSDFFNKKANFPAKTINHATAVGALPSELLATPNGEVYTGDVHIANCLNRVFFGTQEVAANNCNSPGNNANLGRYTATTKTASAVPSNAVYCADENGTCVLPSGSGMRKVYYGASNKYNVLTVSVSVGCNNATFTDPISGTAKKCYYSASDVTGSDAPTSNGGLSTTPYFLTRVSVCDDMSGASPDIRMVNGVQRQYCTRYPNENYKPTGDLQTYSDRIRVSAFGYLMQNDTTQYGGVLRAPMKYVGPTAYDNNFNIESGVNPEAEWDPNTGVFVENPIAGTAAVSPRTTPISGVINYLNQFGRTGALGNYKTQDPVNELYYEVLRYLQGLQPTPAALLNPDKADGFPFYSSWTDPLPAISDLGNTGDYSCVANNIMVIGDVHTHYDKSLPGNTNTDGDFQVDANPAGNMPNFKFWTKVAGGFESNSDVSYIDGTGATRNTLADPAFNTDPNSSLAGLEGQNPSDHSNYFMVGAAYWANTHDIRGVKFTGDNDDNAQAWASSTDKQRPGMRAKTYVIDVNETSSSTELNTRKNNQFFLTAKYGGFNADNSLGGNPFMDAKGNPDPLWERGSTKDPKTYFLASDAATVLNSIDQIFATIAADTASIAGTSTTSTTVTDSNGGSRGFRASFSPTDWSGNIYPFSITTDASNNVTVTPNLSGVGGWQAAAQLNAKNAIDRNIVVGTGVKTGGVVAADFKIFGDLSITQQAQIADATKIASDANIGQKIVDYIRGDSSNEPAFRKRSGKLGDIINSGIVYEGAPSTAITETSYKTFYSNHKSRQAAVYVGANDGMLHAFNADTGDELFAYIPSFLVPKLSALTDSSYVHQSYMDATPFVGEAQLGTADTDWKTVLVSGAGGGGQGVIALDVTDPANFTKDSVLWEFTDQDDADMGNVIGTPGIYKLRTSDPTATTATFGWFAIVASGVNNYADDGHSSATGEPTLFILDLSKAKATAWVENTNYFKVTFPQTSTDNTPRGMANFSVVAPNGIVSRIYAGDLQGNLWALNFNVGTDSWNFAGLNAHGDKPIFVAKSGASKLQPITSAPQITSYGSNLIVVFGTGKYIEANDNTASGTQTAYAILDPIGGALPAETNYPLARASLHPLTASDGAVTGDRFVWGIPANTSEGHDTYAGWYFDLPTSSTSGERFVSNFAIYAGTIFANSIVPATGGCSEGGSNSYVLSTFNGNGNFSASSVGLVGSPILIAVGTPTGGTSATNGLPTKTTTIVPVNSGSAGVDKGNLVNKIIEVGVRSWREIFSYQSLHD